MIPTIRAKQLKAFASQIDAVMNEKPQVTGATRWELMAMLKLDAARVLAREIAASIEHHARHTTIREQYNDDTD